jgi:hypothetical protein
VEIVGALSVVIAMADPAAPVAPAAPLAPLTVALLIPSTSFGRDEWKSAKDTYLYTHTLRTFAITYNKGYEYRFYIGIDRGDRLYDSEEVKTFFRRFVGVLTNVTIEFVYMDDIAKGHLTVMWNRLFERAFADGCDFFFQCGDDISFETAGWVGDCVAELEQRNGVGLTGPINNNNRILTQTFVSRKHMDLFGYYFPPEIINWCCDDWINWVYQHLGAFCPLRQHLCLNVGGAPRYVVANDPEKQRHLARTVVELRAHCQTLVQRDVARVAAAAAKKR